MQFSNTKEDGLETIIVDWLVKHNGYEQGTNADYNKEYAIDETRLFRFLADTQPDEMEKLAVFKSEQKKRTFLNRLQGELAKRGIIDVLRNGIKVYPADRFLVVADMFQTGFDEPLLHTMYVDKQLYDIQAVQTLSRLNRCHPKKHDTCVLDFANKPEIIQESFSRYYRTTILSGETDPNKLYDLISAMEKHQVYSRDDIENEVNLYLNGAQRDKLDYILDVCTNIYKTLEIEEQIEFKSSAKAFCRTYGFLGAILPYGNPEWEKLSIFLNLLIPKLPSPQDDDLSQGILETIDLDSYRTEARETMSIQLDDADSEMAPVPAGKSGHIVSPEMDLLSIIVSEFNDMFGNIDWKEPDNARRQILEIPAMVSKDEKYRNAMRNSDEQSAKLESERALQQQGK